MKGLTHTATIYERSGGEWVVTADTWKCFLQPLSDTTRVEGTLFPQSTHKIMGATSPTIVVGMKLEIEGGLYFVNGIQSFYRPGYGVHHQQVYCTRAEN